MADLDKSHQQYNEDTDALLEVIRQIVSSGELTEQNKTDVSQLKTSYNESYLQVNADIEAVRNAQNEHSMNSIKNNLLDIKTDVDSATSDAQQALSDSKTNGNVITQVIHDVDQFKVIVEETYIDNESFDTKMQSALTINNQQILTEVANNYATQGYVNTEIANAKLDGTDIDLSGYVTEVELNSAVDQRADEILSTVSATYTTKDEAGNFVSSTQLESVIDQTADGIMSTVSSTYQPKSDMDNYYTAKQVNTAIDQKADSITSTVSTTYQTKEDAEENNGEFDARVSELELTVEGITSRVSDVENKYETTLQSSKTMYYLSDSRTKLIGGTWKESVSQQGGKYIWLKIVYYYSDGSSSEGTPVCIQGADGNAGEGAVLYTWIRYADDAQGTGISNDPTGKSYIGFAYNQTTQVESNNPSHYIWSKIQGDKGDQGVPGEPGTTYYTWIKYSDNADGNPCYDTPTSTTQYIGIAHNQTSISESSDYTKYTWSKFRGDRGVKGPSGPTGPSGEKGQSLVSSTPQYYLSTSSTTQTGGSWSTTMPTMVAGKYMWSRFKLVWENPSQITYTSPILDKICETIKGIDEHLSEVEQTANKISWLVKSGTSESNMVLTDNMYSLVTGKVLVEAKKIELNGSININDGLFKVATNGNMKIGGSVGQIIENYERAQFEVTSNGTVYSVSPTDIGVYSKLTEGRLYTNDGSESTTIQGGQVITYSVGTNSIGNRSGSSIEINGGDYSVEMKTSGGNGYFSPINNDEVRLGTSTYKWASIWCTQSALNTSSDRRTKTDIAYYTEDDRFEKMFMDLKPCTFLKTDSEFGRHHSGLIAQEVEEAMVNNGLDYTDFGALLKIPVDEHGEELNINNTEQMRNCVDYQYGLRYGEFTALSIHMIQKLYSKINELEQEIKSLKE